MLKIIELFWRFLLLGFVSFGGPAAHIGYFRTAFVEKLKWLDDKAYANLIALSQFLPGPSSSQVGFAIGLNYGGLGGAIAAFFGFTLPSFLLLYLLAVLDVSSAQSHLLDGMINGLKLFAVVVVADAIYGMYKSFCKDFLTKSVALMTAFALLFFATLFSQILVLLLAALIGMVYRKKSTDMTQTKI
jgi:chromate transporter